MSYEDFLALKLTRVPPTGLASAPPLHPSLFPHQRDLTSWALRRGRAALFEGTGLGKTRQELEWARCVSEATDGRVLVLAPLAVAQQVVSEASDLGIDISYAREECGAKLTVTNYERLHRFDAKAYAGVVLDESSIIKHHDAKTLHALLDAFSDTPFRLAATATPAPNDYAELGTHAEFLGICTRAEMLSEFFVHDGGDTSVWRLKGHARKPFWRWVASWGALLRSPSDLGYDDAGYKLPPLDVFSHVVPGSLADARADGFLFPVEAKTLSERRSARRGSIAARVAACVETIVREPDEPWLVWCELNDESAALAKAIPGAIEVRGSHSLEWKEDALAAFAAGRVRALVTKPSIAGWGLNLQRCARQAFVGVSDSWEAYYQAVRRSWRFGQTRGVHAHIFYSEAEGSVLANLQRKERDAERMAAELSSETREVMRASVQGATRATNEYRAPSVVLPAWLTEVA